MSATLAPVTVTPTAPPIMAIEHEGKPWVSAKHICETLGVDWAGQFTKLKSKPWAVIELIPTTASDGKQYKTSMVDRRTLTMWLATIDTNRVIGWQKDELHYLEKAWESYGKAKYRTLLAENAN